jgi:UDP-2,3-diacylglucosamine hydrolase
VRGKPDFPMPRTLFISDLHLCSSRPAINELFFRFLRDEAAHAEALYILGDFFEYWIGDDDIEGLNRKVVDALATLSKSGVRLYFMHGNRDFLIGERFASEAGLKLLADPTEVDLYGRRVLLSHGDALCTGDADYVRFRAMVRSTEWQRAFLAKPLAERRKEVEEYRRRSELAKSTKPMDIMDVAPSAVDDLLRAHGYPTLIHGHTHRPATHRHDVDEHVCERWVMSDWHAVHGEYLEAQPGSLARIAFT